MSRSRLRQLTAILAWIAVTSVASIAQHRSRSVLLDWGEFQTIGDVPPEFGVVILNLSTIRLPRKGRIATRKISGTLEADGVTEIKLVAPAIHGRRLSFGTRVKNGVAYHFSGAFPEDYPLDAHGSPDGPILQGSLTKLRNGKELATAELVFRFQFYSD